MFAGEQSAIGERMVTRARERADCMGYGAFLDQLPTGKDPLVDALRDDVMQTSKNVGLATPRLVALQHALIDLLAFLDSDNVRFSEDRRSKVNA